MCLKIWGNAPDASLISVFLPSKDHLMALQDKYINPFTDFGFKKLFGSEPNKDLLIDFLNQVLPVKHKVKDLSYARTEQLGNSETDRKAIFDLYCIAKMASVSSSKCKRPTSAKQRATCKTSSTSGCMCCNNCLLQNRHSITGAGISNYSRLRDCQITR